MTDELQQKVIDGLVKTVVAAFTGGGVVKLSSTWLGEEAFQSLEELLKNGDATVLFQNDPLPALFEAWSRRVFSESLAGLENIVMIVFIALLAVVGHVVMRGSLEQGDGADEPATERTSATSRLLRLYDRLHYGLTLTLFLVLAAVLWYAPSQPAMAVAFGLLTVPGTLYLVLYAADVRRPRFVPRFTWIACAMMIFAALFISPRVYGERFFDVGLIQVRTEDGRQVRFAFKDAPDVLCNIEMEHGALGVWIEKTDRQYEVEGLETETTLRKLAASSRGAKLKAEEALAETERIILGMEG